MFFSLNHHFLSDSNVWCSRPASWTPPKTTPRAPGRTWRLKFSRRNTGMLRARLLLQHPWLRLPRACLHRLCLPPWVQAHPCHLCLMQPHLCPLPLPARKRESNRNNRRKIITETFGRLGAFCTSSQRTGGRGTKSCKHARPRLARKKRGQPCKPTSISSFFEDFGKSSASSMEVVARPCCCCG